MTKKRKTNRKKKAIDGSDGYKKFMQAIKGHSKDISILLRCHLIAEYFLDQIITTCISRGDLIVTDGRFTYSNKLLLVKGLDVVDDEVLTSLKHLNRIRNNCSHQMDYTISEADVDLIGRPYGNEYSKLKQKGGDVYFLLEGVLLMTIAFLERDYNLINN